MKSIITIFCIILCIGGCKEKNPTPIIIDLNIEIRYFDSDNRDLLDQSKSYAFNFDNMKHYYLNSSNNKVIVNINNLTYPKEMLIYKDADSIPATLRFFPHIETYENGLRNFTDYIQLNSTDEDTIQTQIEITNSTRVIKSVKYNGQNVGRNIIITK